MKIRHLLAGIAFVATAAYAQLSIEITGAGANRIPIAVADFSGERIISQALASVVRVDLEHSGLFQLVDAAGKSTDGGADYPGWKARGADALVTGSIGSSADGRYETRFHLFDVQKQAELGGNGYLHSADQLRTTAHRIADFVYEKLTGERGIFSTRIAYVVKSTGRFELRIADSDGQNSQAALSSREPIISPTWSPDGKKLAVVLTKDGSSQLYLLNADGSGVARIATSAGIDTEPQFSPDGQAIYFTSDRGGSPQIYRIAVSGGDAQRVTFEGSYNVTPRPSPDGRSLAYVTRNGGRFQLALMDLATRQTQILTDSAKDESPSFAPNGRMIIYATEVGGRGVLAAVSSDGRVKQKLSVQAADVREPSWGPFVK